MDRNKRLGLLGWLRVLSLSARRAWIEITTYFDTSSIDESLSARRAWIEIMPLSSSPRLASSSLSARRAWIEIVAGTRYDRPPLSLSARRAWIEINTRCREIFGHYEVALRKESVDRNRF